jgi:SAM-dependent methyltransferase
MMKDLADNVMRWLYKNGFYKKIIPKEGAVILGDLNRTSPFSEEFGYDRGGPIDRYYIESFLQKNKALIQGKVLEIGDNEYTLRFGNPDSLQSEIFDVDPKNSKANFVGDLSNAPFIPDNSYDCIILTQTLQMIYNYKDAIATCFRILKPGGSLLLTVPGISNIDFDEWNEYWMFSFTTNSIKRILLECFPIERISVETYGNVLTATAFLYGMGFPELEKEQIDFTDPHYQLIISAVATKSE